MKLLKVNFVLIFCLFLVPLLSFAEIAPATIVAG